MLKHKTSTVFFLANLFPCFFFLLSTEHKYLCVSIKQYWERKITIENSKGNAISSYGLCSDYMVLHCCNVLWNKDFYYWHFGRSVLIFFSSHFPNLYLYELIEQGNKQSGDSEEIFGHTTAWLRSTNTFLIELYTTFKRTKTLAIWHTNTNTCRHPIYWLWVK